MFWKLYQQMNEPLSIAHCPNSSVHVPESHKTFWTINQQSKEPQSVAHYCNRLAVEMLKIGGSRKSYVILENLLEDERTPNCRNCLPVEMSKIQV